MDISSNLEPIISDVPISESISAWAIDCVGAEDGIETDVILPGETSVVADVTSLSSILNNKLNELVGELAEYSHQTEIPALKTIYIESSEP